MLCSAGLRGEYKIKDRELTTLVSTELIVTRCESFSFDFERVCSSTGQASDELLTDSDVCGKDRSAWDKQREKDEETYRSY